MPESPPPEPILVQSVALSSSKGIEHKDPKRAVIALEMLCTGSGYRDVELATGLGFDTLLGLRTRHEAAIEVRRAQLAADGFELVEGLRLLVKEKMSKLASDPSELKKVNIRDLMMSYGLAYDKGMHAMEGNKTVVEHVTKRPTLADAQKAIDEARKELQKEAIPV